MSSTAEQFGIGNVPFGIATSIKHPSPQAVSRFGDSVIVLSDLVIAGIIIGVTDVNLQQILSEVRLKTSHE
jgi:hypothetical protein